VTISSLATTPDKERHRFTTPGIALAVLAGSLAASAAAQTRLDTLQQGRYECALPGSAAGAAWIVQRQKGFDIASASTYRTMAGSGTYLLTDNIVTFTRGPMKDMRMKQHGSGLLQELRSDETLGPLRCHRKSALPR
jgi:hypothetical protein